MVGFLCVGVAAKLEGLLPMALALVADGRLNLLEKAVVGAIKLGTLATG